MMKKWLFISLIWFFGSIVCAQDSDKILSVKDMRADLDYYFSSLQDVHPNPFIYLTKSEFQSKVDSVKNLISKPLTKKEFYRTVFSLNKYTDLHTRIIPSKKMVKQMNGAFLLPTFATDGDTVFICRNDNQKFQLVQVNGVNVDSIRLFFSRNENLVEPMRQHNFLDELNLYKNAHFWTDELTFSFIDRDKHIDNLTIKSTEPKKDSKQTRIYNLVYDSVKSIAIFELNTFLPAKTKEQLRFPKAVNDVFDTLNHKKIKRLYIDLTANNGGLITFEEYLLNYLLSDNVANNLWDLTIKNSKQRTKQRGAIVSSSNADYYQERHSFTPSKVKNKFKGEVFIIQSRHSFSAASTLASQLQKFRSCEIIGEECQAKAVYTDPILLRLPNSKFMFSCATGFIRNVGKDKSRGVIPDIPCEIYDVFDAISIEKAEQMRLNNRIEKDISASETTNDRQNK